MQTKPSIGRFALYRVNRSGSLIPNVRCCNSNPQVWSAMIESVTTLPFNRHIGIQKSSTDDGLLELPQGEQFLNHIGTVHAGAQLALAEACSGEFLLNTLANETGIIPVVRRVEAKFKKPANGRVTAKINTALTVIDQSLDDLAVKGRCLLTVHVDVYDEQGQHSLSSNFEWFVARSSHT